MTYCRGQFRNIFQFVKRTPQWLILGGPADGDEAQCAVRKWPGLKVIGIEPVEHFRRWQRTHGWPGGHPLLDCALSDMCGTAELHALSDDPRSSSLMPERQGGGVETVRTMTIDSLSELFGPFTNAILWLDIEGYEYEALMGANRLFAAGEVLAVNVEVIERRAEATERIEAFFADREFEPACKWNERDGFHDRIYVPRKGN